MIQVLMTDTETGRELARVEIEQLGAGDGQHADYSVRFASTKGFSVTLHQRGVLNFPYRQYNALALLLQALKTLDEGDLAYDSSWDDFVEMVQLNLSKIETIIQENLHDE